MPSQAYVIVHPSQFPDAVKESLLESLRSRRVAPKFHYQSYKQAELWLALHRAHSPAWLDPEAEAIYERSFRKVVEMIPERRVGLIGLGCGGGYKEARLLRLLAGHGKELDYAPCDVSLPLVLDATREALGACGGLGCRPVVCDLTQADDLPAVLGFAETGARRIMTFFGMMPNIEPEQVLPKLAAFANEGDVLLLSANLAPGPDYRAGVNHVLPGYDNAETRAWLLAFLFDLGAETTDGAIEFSIEEANGLCRIVADYRFARERTLRVYDEAFRFCEGDTIRLFFSYRHTSSLMSQLLKQFGWDVMEQWITASGEEGVFLCRKTVVET